MGLVLLQLLVYKRFIFTPIASEINAVVLVQIVWKKRA